jgi:hypothetical protein
MLRVTLVNSLDKISSFLSNISMDVYGITMCLKYFHMLRPFALILIFYCQVCTSLQATNVCLGVFFNHSCKVLLLLSFLRNADGKVLDKRISLDHHFDVLLLSLVT